jgi:hypothetical protein
MIVTITREQPPKDDATLGILRIDGLAECATLELPWKDNFPKVSCIPTGFYHVTKFNSPSKGRVFLLHDVLNRSMIEIHSGNTIDDIQGCILVGRTHGTLAGKRAVLHSRNTLERLLNTLPDEFEIEIL